MDFAIDKLAQDAVESISLKIKNLNKLNIIVAGKTGVGKSTLINAVFRENLAETGIGKPVTNHMRRITKKDFPLNIYDTRGFELGKEVQNEVKNEIVNTIRSGFAAKDINSAIHCIWYCINTASNRVEPEEIQWIRELTKENQITEVPIIIVLTQAISKPKAEEMTQVLLNENLNVVQIIPVLASDYEINDEYKIRSYGLDRLVKIMEQLLPEELLDVLAHVEKANLKLKKDRAQAAVATASMAAIGEAAVPIPLADCAMLIPTQISMLASITVIFGFDVNKSIIAAIISSTLGSGGATVLGKTVVSSILKLIPGAGSVVGGVVSASTAGVITAALGEAYIAILELVFNGEIRLEDIGTDKGLALMSTLFKNNLKMNKTNSKS